MNPLWVAVALQRFFAPPSLVTIQEALRNVLEFGAAAQPNNLIDLLRTCPTAVDIERVRALPILIDGSLLRPWSCSIDGSETSIELSIINQFRVMAAMRFDSPIPLLGTMTVYDWVLEMIASGTLRSIHYANRVGTVRGGAAAAGSADVENKTITLDAAPFAEDWTRRDLDQAGMSAIVPIGLLVHEARHLQGFIHSCQLRSGNSDQSLAYGGAFAVSYWWALWCADHSGNFLPASVRDSLRARANSMRDTVFCE